MSWPSKVPLGGTPQSCVATTSYTAHGTTCSPKSRPRSTTTFGSLLPSPIYKPFTTPTTKASSLHTPSPPQFSTEIGILTSLTVRDAPAIVRGPSSGVPVCATVSQLANALMAVWAGEYNRCSLDFHTSDNHVDLSPQQKARSPLESDLAAH
jgi:hypothetical protein